MLEFRKNAEGVLQRIARGERLLLSHRGKPAARLEPVRPTNRPTHDDPFLTITQRATPSPKGPLRHEDIDCVLYGRRYVFVDTAGFGALWDAGGCLSAALLVLPRK